MSDVGRAELGCRREVFGPLLDVRVWGIRVPAREIHFGAVHKGAAIRPWDSSRKCGYGRRKRGTFLGSLYMCRGEVKGGAT